MHKINFSLDNEKLKFKKTKNIFKKKK